MRAGVEDRVAELHRVLLETEEDRTRARAHLELGALALGERRVDLAIRHFREALHLDPKLERARSALAHMGVSATAGAPVQRRFPRPLRWVLTLLGVGS